MLRGRIEPMYIEDVRLAGELADRYLSLSARDLVHLAVGQRVGARYIVSADKGFDAGNEIERLDPLRVDEWRSLVVA
jgi:predicted nucleic acid-binding protein